ncbi:putative RNA polymerase sigma factor FecI (Sigma-19) [Nitrospira japonica]|uniref:Putative RNA polymerase sigma factor FecI (Sigma-19) n=1 Tax=Nitrospira japonica TaxID=1325564 RepID=A0A1W1IAM5_9BACT|nr:sigma-70 family RNA polymerase sigma factor [Nitrospira japonica]SLM50107.1 putative RNA polymerase sigma factor FecI (Sigma-19) [Nitrospira japonica]
MSDQDLWCLTPMPTSPLGMAFQQYAQELQRFLQRRLGCPEAAADLLQETFLRVAQLPASTQPDNPRAFLFRIASNLAIDELRRNQVRRPFQEPLEEAEHVPSATPSCEQAIFDKQRMTLLQSALEQLSPRCRTIFMLRRVQGHSYDEIAHRLGVSERIVAKEINRALAHCQQALLAALKEQP